MASRKIIDPLCSILNESIYFDEFADFIADIGEENVEHILKDHVFHKFVSTDVNICRLCLGCEYDNDKFVYAFKRLMKISDPYSIKIFNLNEKLTIARANGIILRCLCISFLNSIGNDIYSDLENLLMGEDTCRNLSIKILTQTEPQSIPFFLFAICYYSCRRVLNVPTEERSSFNLLKRGKLDLSNIDLSYCNLSRDSINKLPFQISSFKKTNLTGTLFRNVYIHNPKFDTSIMDMTILAIKNEFGFEDFYVTGRQNMEIGFYINEKFLSFLDTIFKKMNLLD